VPFVHFLYMVLFIYASQGMLLHIIHHINPIQMYFQTIYIYICIQKCILERGRENMLLMIYIRILICYPKEQVMKMKNELLNFIQ